MIARLVMVVVLLLFAVSAHAQGTSVEMFSPQGTVKDVQQVTARFSEQMVPFGEPRAVEPFEIVCPEKGTAKWLDGRTWVFDFKRNLPAGITCTFTVKQGIKALSGQAMAGQRIFAFSTGGPAVRSMRPRDESKIAEDQIFALVLDAEATDESVLKSAFFSVKDIHERLPVQMVNDEERAQVLKALGWDKQKGHFMVIQCPRRFPNGGDVAFVWGSGVASKSGALTTQPQTFRFKVRDAFTARFRCMRESPKAGCIPLLPMQLEFSAPIARDAAEKITLRSGGTVYRPDFDRAEDQWPNRVVFKGPFAEKSELALSLPADFKDDAGRTLANRSRFPLAVKTAGYPPLAKFAARFGMIESAHPYLPVTVRNLEPFLAGKTLDIPDEPDVTQPSVSSTPSPAASANTAAQKGQLVQNLAGRVQRVDSETEIIRWLERIAYTRREVSVFKAGDRPSPFSMPRPGGKKAFEVVGIPLGKNGFHVVEMESTILGTALLGKPKPMYVSAAAIVTNLSAHFKWGAQTSLVWVTALDNAKPVPGAVVSIRNVNGAEIWRGRTDERGIAMITTPLPRPSDLPQRRSMGAGDYAFYEPGPLQEISGGLYVFARTKEDMTFVHSSWSEGIEPWQFKLSQSETAGREVARTVFDRTLFRRGETVHMKHVVRRQTLTGFSLLKKEELPGFLLIEHTGTDQSWEITLTWDVSRGVAESTWAVPADAKLGTYRVALNDARSKERRSRGEPDNPWPETTGSFRVEEFRVPLMKGVIQPVGEPLVNASEVPVDLLVTYLSGGGASDLPVRLRGNAVPKTVTFEDYPEVVFSNGPVKVGITKRPDEDVYWDADELEDMEEPERAQTRKKEPEGLQAIDVRLSDAGAARAILKSNPGAGGPQELIMELEFSDPNGEIVTVSRGIPLWPSSVLIGISPDSWALSPDTLKFHVIALDLKGTAKPGTSVKVEVLQRTSYSHRKRLVGGFYSYEHASEVKGAGTICEGRTDERGLLICEVKSPVKGNAILQATATDSSGNPSTAHADVWIGGEDEWWFKAGDTDRIDLLPEKKRYEPGETASLQVRMPFREATVLVTVEREGIIDAFIQRVSGSNPVLTVPVKGAYAPNVYVSALCVRGRVQEPKPTALVDLGKPAFKLGIAEIAVGWQAHELKVRVTTDREAFRVRETVRAKVNVRKADGGKLPRGGEVAVAVVDEGLLELKPNTSWQLLEQMMQRRGYAVQTSTGQMQVVGKRHYGRKALPPGGGGGKHPTRELFDTLIFWQGRVPLDENGEATVEFPLKDALSSFRIVAVATADAGLFGTGSVSVRTKQELMLFSGLPRLVRQGDRFRAGFTVRNAAERPMDVEIFAQLQTTKGSKELERLSETLKPGEARNIGWDVTVEQDIDALRWELGVREKGGQAIDSLKVSQRAVPAVPVRVVQAFIDRLEKPLDVTVEAPKGGIRGAGGLSVGFAPKLAGSTEAIVRYMRDYIYTCLEQKTSIAVALRDEKAWKSVMSELPAYLDGSGLAKYFPEMLYGSDVLTTYLLAIANEAGWQIPDKAKGRMVAGLQSFVEGRTVRYSPIAVADVTIRKLAAMEALARHGKFEQRLLDPLAIDPNLWPTSAVIDWISLLSRTNLPDKPARLKQADQILRSRVTMRGTVMTFSTEKTDAMWWNMVSVDLNAVRTVLVALGLDGWKEDMARLVRGALSRQLRGRWNTTIANAWGVLMLEKFSKTFEAVPVTGESSASLGREKKSVAWSESPGGKSMLFNWPRSAEPLRVSHAGQGVPWVHLQSLAAVPLQKPLFSGYTVKKELTPVQQRQPGVWTRGDVVRVRLELEAQSDMTWVVVNDPVPAGSSILGTGLGRDSRILTSGEERRGWVRPVFEERSFEAFRAYYDYVPRGKWIVEYTFRVNNPGVFLLPETRIEALYAPEVFGELPNKPVTVKE